MLLQSSSISQPPLHHNYTSLLPNSSRSSLSLSIQYPSGSFSISTLQSQSILASSPLFKCSSSISQVHSYNTVDYENKPYVKWRDVFQRVFRVDTDYEKGTVAVLKHWEDEGNELTKWEINKITKELRKRKRYSTALAMIEWMTAREEKYPLSTSDVAVQLDLIAKVRGIPEAEDFFSELPDTIKDERVYGALLNGYARSQNREKAESFLAQMKELGYFNRSLSFNVMMTLYMSLKDYEKAESVVSEMMANNVPLDIYTYNIWITACGAQGSMEKMEQVIEKMNQDKSVNPNWSSLTTWATMYVNLGELEKAEDCLKQAEKMITGRNRIPYHYIMSIYGLTGNKEEVQRIWKIYKTVFSFIPNLGYYVVISAHVKLNNIEEAEDLYEEWLSVKQNFDARICNRLLLWYVKNGFLEKAEDLFDEISDHGGKPMSSSWEILATAQIKQGKVTEAVSCLVEAVKASTSKNWKPRPVNVSDILELCEKEGDVASREILLGLLKKLGCFEDEGYISCIPRLNPGNNTSIAQGRTYKPDVDDDDEAELLPSQLEAS